MARKLSWTVLISDAHAVLAASEYKARRHDTDSKLEGFVIEALQNLQPKLRAMLDAKEFSVSHTYPEHMSYTLRERFLRMLNRQLPSPFDAWTLDHLNEGDTYEVGLT